MHESEKACTIEPRRWRAQKAAAAKEYAAKKGKVVETEEEEENKPLSGIADRPYCKGRAYDPSRYASGSKED